MANVHTTLTSLFDDIADAIRDNTPVTEQIKADAFPAYIKMLGYDGTIPATPSVLNSCPWDFIRWASDEGIADLLWSVGDRKAVEIGDFGNSQEAYKIPGGTFYCYILGFNHNSDLEGTNRTHFEFGFTALSGGVHIAFTGGDYGLGYTNPSGYGYPIMNNSAINSGGWGSCIMRTKNLNSEESSKSFMSALPSDLKNQVKTVTKYTDNVGGGSNVESNVTATTDKFFLLNMMEIIGGDGNSSNSYEPQKTAQYQYYRNGNDKIRNRSDSIGNPCRIFLRSPYRGNNKSFCRLNETALPGYHNANSSLGISPAFCV